MIYTEAQQEFIRTAWARGDSASEISAQFYSKFHTRVSRSAICGKADRMNLAPRESGSGRWATNGHAKRLATMAARGTKPGIQPKKPVLALPTPSEEPKALGGAGEYLGHGCRWIFGDDPKTWQFCGHPQVIHTPYCEVHRLKALPQPHGNQPKRPRTFMNTDRQFR